jgi:hypothetical protein
MAAIAQNWQLDLDRSYVLVIPIMNLDGSPAQLSGASATWGLGLNASSTRLIMKSTGSGGITLTHDSSIPPVWTAQVSINPVDTNNLANLVPGLFYHELTIVDVTGAIVNVTKGSVTVLDSLNRF